MRSLVRSCGLLLTTMLAMVGSVSLASACSCVELTTAEQVERAELVARVVVERIERPTEENYTALPSSWSLFGSWCMPNVAEPDRLSNKGLNELCG